MPTSRRIFLKSGAIAAFSAALFFSAEGLAAAQKDRKGERKSGLFRIPDSAKKSEVFYYKKSTFDPYLNTEFRARVGRVTIRLTLVKVIEYVPQASKGRRQSGAGESFTLIFRADRKLVEGITIYQLEHDALGKFDLFLGNTKEWDDPDGLYYQAVINHMTS